MIIYEMQYVIPDEICSTMQIEYAMLNKNIYAIPDAIYTMQSDKNVSDAKSYIFKTMLPPITGHHNKNWSQFAFNKQEIFFYLLASFIIL